MARVVREKWGKEVSDEKPLRYTIRLELNFQSYGISDGEF